mmetsp:Transcript_11117/g.41535  ORF Transcript_11117/g.41535 Transcript_11117/m.41535 type:complete len:269 (+) Transcript_11117:193-999(+)|eukprot:scaffold279_cov229-Pinguiococcus_pyrenoidosus.AAC.21
MPRLAPSRWAGGHARLRGGPSDGPLRLQRDQHRQAAVGGGVRHDERHDGRAAHGRRALWGRVWPAAVRHPGRSTGPQEHFLGLCCSHDAGSPGLGPGLPRGRLGRPEHLCGAHGVALRHGRGHRRRVSPVRRQHGGGRRSPKQRTVARCSVQHDGRGPRARSSALCGAAGSGGVLRGHLAFGLRRRGAPFLRRTRAALQGASRDRGLPGGAEASAGGREATRSGGDHRLEQVDATLDRHVRDVVPLRHRALWLGPVLQRDPGAQLGSL